MRDIASPSKASKAKMKRLGRYLKGLPRMRWQYKWQKKQSVIETPVDSDWGPDTGDRKSTSAGALMLGAHTIAYWSVTQPTPALSSGESEF